MSSGNNMQGGELTYSEAFPPLPGAASGNGASTVVPISPKSFGGNQWNKMSVRSSMTTQVFKVCRMLL